MDLRYEIEATQYVVRVYDESHPDNYVAHALVRVYGDVGWMSSIVGARFYEAIADNFDDICAQCKVSSLEGYMTDAHARLVRMKTRGKSIVTTPTRGICAGREMPWVVLRPIKKD